MSSDYIPFFCPGGFTILPGSAIIYLHGEATTARAMVPGERGRTIVGGCEMEVTKLHVDTVTMALPYES